MCTSGARVYSRRDAPSIELASVKALGSFDATLAQQWGSLPKATQAARSATDDRVGLVAPGQRGKSRPYAPQHSTTDAQVPFLASVEPWRGPATAFQAPWLQTVYSFSICCQYDALAITTEHSLLT